MSTQRNGLTHYSVLMPLAPWELPGILREALLSLQEQTLPPNQIVISCDGSPSTGLRNLLDTIDLPLDIIIGPGEEGVGPVLARGLRACSNELVIRADADDISLPNRCAIQVSWMSCHPEILASGCLIDEFCKRSDHPISQRTVPIGEQEILQGVTARNPLSHPSVILRRSAVLAAGNYRSKPGFEDYDLWLRLLRNNGRCVLANLPEALVLARVGPAHLNRRHGWHYAWAETNFFVGCGREGLMEWPIVIRNLALRLPLRLLPAELLSKAMAVGTRRRLSP